MKNILLILLFCCFGNLMKAQIFNPSYVKFKTIPETLYYGDSVKLEIFAYFNSGDNNCYVFKDSIERDQDTFDITVRYFTSFEANECITIDTFSLGTLDIGVYQVNYNGSSNQSTSERLDTFYFEVLSGFRNVENQISTDVKISQNSDKTVFIHYDGNQELQVAMFNILGKKVEEDIVRKGSTLMAIPERNGLYFMVLRDQNGKIVKTKKLVY